MFKRWLRAGGAACVFAVAGMLLTAGSGRAQVYNTVAVSTPYGFTFYTFPANYAPTFVPMYPAWWGYPNIGLAPYYYPYGTHSATFDLQPPPRKARPREAVPKPKTPKKEDKTAAIDVQVSAGARVWIQGKETMQTGAV